MSAAQVVLGCADHGQSGGQRRSRGRWRPGLARLRCQAGTVEEQAHGDMLAVPGAEGLVRQATTHQPVVPLVAGDLATHLSSTRSACTEGALPREAVADLLTGWCRLQQSPCLRQSTGG